MDILLGKYGLPRSILSNSVNIRPYLPSKMSITVLLYSHGETIKGRYMCSNLWSHVQNTNAFSYALLLAHRVFIAFLLFDVALFWRSFHIYWKSGHEWFRGTRIYWITHFKWIWSDNFWPRDSAQPIAVEEKHRLYNNHKYILICHVTLRITKIRRC